METKKLIQGYIKIEEEAVNTLSQKEENWKIGGLLYYLNSLLMTPLVDSEIFDKVVVVSLGGGAVTIYNEENKEQVSWIKLPFEIDFPSLIFERGAGEEEGFYLLSLRIKEEN